MLRMYTVHDMYNLFALSGKYYLESVLQYHVQPVKFQDLRINQFSTMKTLNIILIIAATFALVYFLKPCKKPATVTVHSEKIREFHDTITRIKKEYQTQILTVQKSTRPDTFIRNLTDTVFGNHDSFIYVTVLQGRECCEVGKWKDSIINLDSIMMERSEANLRKCDAELKRKRVVGKIKNFALFGLITWLGISLIK